MAEVLSPASIGTYPFMLQLMKLTRLIAARNDMQHLRTGMRTNWMLRSSSNLRHRAELAGAFMKKHTIEVAIIVKDWD